MRSHPFTRPTIIAAVEFLGEQLTQAKFDQLVLRLALENELALGSGLSLTARSARLGEAIIRQVGRGVQTAEGAVTLGEAVVREAVSETVQRAPNIKQERLIRSLSLDGFTVSWDSQTPRLQSTLPSVVSIPTDDNEVHRLLDRHQFKVSKGHLDQAIDAHTRGDWAAANSQIRSFLEDLLNEIARRVDAQKASELKTSENLRSMLAQRGFLSVSRNEWTNDGKSYVNGLFKMLHTEGSHPGLSDEDHSTFRLQIGIITARTFLRRLDGVGNLPPSDGTLAGIKMSGW